MNDLLWLVNHPLWGNVMGILTRWNPDIPEGRENRLSIKIHRILAQLLHSTEPELGKLHWARMDFDRASTLKLLRGLSTSEKVLRPSEPHLSLYSTRINLGNVLTHGRPGKVMWPAGHTVIPRSKKEGTKPLYVCPGCSNHTYSNNMITRIHVQ
jgi:hypothetical protein